MANENGDHDELNRIIQRLQEIRERLDHISGQDDIDFYVHQFELIWRDLFANMSDVTLQTFTMTTYNGKTAIPLVLPNNCTWDEQTGKYEKTADSERKTLKAIPKALDQLREIKEPVCVVSIAGPCRKGKSYILSKAFEQDEVFPLGHLLDPETMGIWLWVVPQKYKDSTGRDFTVVLLDSEGIDAWSGTQADDHGIFTLSVLLSSILIYNSAGVPNRSDLEGLDFISKLSQRIHSHTSGDGAKDGSNFYKSFPNFIWLLRDVVLCLPSGCSNIKEYFLKNVLNAEREGSTDKSKKVAESILNFFSGFDAFSLPSPAYNPKVVKNLNNQSLQSQVNPQFLEEVERFKDMLNTKLAPKKSINEEEFVTGEALAAMVQLFVEALNTPGTVPNMQSAWDKFAHNKCTEVINDAVKKYQKEMTSRVKDKIPCEADVIRSEHEKTVDACLIVFRRETLTLSSKSIDKYLTEFMNKANSILESFIQENRRRTEVFCSDLLKKLKQRILNPVLSQLRGPEAAKMEYKDVIAAYNKIEEEYKMEALGAKDVQATIFMNFIPELWNEMQLNIDVLKRMKDYDEEVGIEKAKAIMQEEQQRRIEEEKARLIEEKLNKEKEIALLQEKQKDDNIRLQQMFEEKLKQQKDQLTNMMEANFKALKEEREAALAQQKKLEDVIENLKESLEKKEEEIGVLKKDVENASKPSAIQMLAPLIPPLVKVLSETKKCNVM